MSLTSDNTFLFHHNLHLRLNIFNRFELLHSLFTVRSSEIKDVVSPSFKPRQYDSPFFIELAYPRDTAEQYLVSEQPTFI